MLTNRLGDVALAEGSHEFALSLHSDALLTFRELGDRWGIAVTLERLAAVALRKADLVTAEALARDSMARFNELDHPWGVAQVLLTLGCVARARESNAQAKRLLRQSLMLSGEQGDHYRVPLVLGCIGEIALAEGEYMRGTTTIAAAAALRRQVGAALPPFEQTQFDQSVRVGRVNLGDERFAFAWAEGTKLSFDNAVTYVCGSS